MADANHVGEGSGVSVELTQGPCQGPAPLPSGANGSGEWAWGELNSRLTLRFCSEPQTTWYKIRSRAYTQAGDRCELIDPRAEAALGPL